VATFPVRQVMHCLKHRRMRARPTATYLICKWVSWRDPANVAHSAAICEIRVTETPGSALFPSICNNLCTLQNGKETAQSVAGVNVRAGPGQGAR
jgi:hypothetical protein